MDLTLKQVPLKSSIIAFTSLIARCLIILPHAFIDAHLYALFLAFRVCVVRLV